MKKKPRFNPEITRVKLNPEQAVLQCACFDDNTQEGGRASAAILFCVKNVKSKVLGCTDKADLAAS